MAIAATTGSPLFFVSIAVRNAEEAPVGSAMRNSPCTSSNRRAHARAESPKARMATARPFALGLARGLYDCVSVT